MIFNRRSLIRGAGVFLLSWTLAGCASKPSETAQHSKHPKPHHELTQGQVNPVTASAYILHLSLAKLALENHAPDTAEHLAAITVYDAREPKLPFFQPAVILTYRTRTKNESQRVLAPMGQDNAGFPELAPVLKGLSATPYTLQDIETGIVALPATETPLPQSDPLQREKALDRRLLLLSQSSRRMPLLEQAQLQMQLTRFFMKHNVRDAAYLCMDNARQSLGHITENTTANSEAVRDLSRRLDILEDDLHRNMPFNLSSF